MNDERDDDQEIQKGDTVLEVIDGKPVMYTEPEWVFARACDDELRHNRVRAAEGP